MTPPAQRLATAILALLGTVALAVGDENLRDRGWFPKAPPLPMAQVDVIDVATVEQLFQAAQNVKPGGTIRVADGHYMMPRFFQITTDRVTLRGASGNRNEVILDGLQSKDGELVGITGCHDVTIADLTIQNIKWNGFKINSNLGADRVTIHNCVIHNIWQRGVKAPAVPKDKQHLSPLRCSIQYCLFYNDRAKRFSDDETDTPSTFDGNYIGGIDAKNTVNWTISDNVFIGIQGRTREGRACIYISENGRRCQIERNTCIDCDIGIALGNPSLGYSPLQAIDCEVRNNLVWNCPETGILACYTIDCRIVGNTIHEPESHRKRLIWLQRSNDGLEVSDNLLVGAPVLTTTSSQTVQRNNQVRQSHSGTAPASASDAGQDRLNGAALVDLARYSAQRTTSKTDDAQGTDSEKQSSLRVRDAQIKQVRADVPNWVEPMRLVHSRFKGDAGVFALFGDSITDSRAFWFGLPQQRRNASEEMESAFSVVNSHMLKGCWDRKGARYGNQSGQTIRWAQQNVDQWLKDLNPEVALIMFGSNDLVRVSAEQYEQTTRAVVKRCLDSGTVVILSTIPPRHGYVKKCEEFAEALRKIARDLKVPLIDYHAEILRRRPDDWDGSLDQFNSFNGYDVPTLISRDGVHPSNPKNFRNDYSREALRCNGFALRNHLALTKYAMVIRNLLRDTPAKVESHR